LKLDTLRNHLVRDVPAGADEVAAGPQVPTPELRPQASMILQEMVGRLALDRLHDPARRGAAGRSAADGHGPAVPGRASYRKPPEGVA